VYYIYIQLLQRFSYDPKQKTLHRVNIADISCDKSQEIPDEYLMEMSDKIQNINMALSKDTRITTLILPMDQLAVVITEKKIVVPVVKKIEKKRSPVIGMSKTNVKTNALAKNISATKRVVVKKEIEAKKDTRGRRQSVPDIVQKKIDTSDDDVLKKFFKQFKRNMNQKFYSVVPTHFSKVYDEFYVPFCVENQQTPVTTRYFRNVSIYVHDYS
jgi:hypothetical protein